MAKNRVTGIVRSSPTEAPPRMSRDEQAERRRYETEDALRTLTRAKEIEGNRSLMADVRRMATEQTRTLQKITKK